YKPPPYLAACSQGAWTRTGGPLLVRNYDYAPSRFEGIVWSTRLLERRGVGGGGCPWGLLAGVKDARRGGSLSLGGRRAARGRGRVRHPDRHPIPPGDVHDGRRGAHDACAAALLAQPQPHVGRPRRARPDRVPLAGSRADLPRVPGGHEPPGDRRVARTGPGDP